MVRVKGEKMIDATMITKNQIVKEYGWTKRLVEKYLSNPKLKYNYRNPKKPIKLYPISEVEMVMKSENFKWEFKEIERKRKNGKN